MSNLENLVLHSQKECHRRFHPLSVQIALQKLFCVLGQLTGLRMKKRQFYCRIPSGEFYCLLFTLFFDRHEELVEMQERIWAVRREAFCWLDDITAVITSYDSAKRSGHCIILNTVKR